MSHLVILTLHSEQLRCSRDLEQFPWRWLLVVDGSNPPERQNVLPASTHPMKSSRRTRQYWRKASKKASSATNKQKPNEAPKAKIKNRLSFFENFLLLSGYGRLQTSTQKSSCGQWRCRKFQWRSRSCRGSSRCIRTAETGTWDWSASMWRN